MKQKQKIAIGILSCIFALMVAALIWWLTPKHFLHGVHPENVSTIEVFNGNSGNRFEITDAKDITLIVSQIQEVPMKKESLSIGMGTTYNLRFLNANGKEIDKFIIMSADTIRSGIVFYHCDGQLKPAEDYLIELEKAQFPDSEWAKYQSNSNVD